MEWKRWTPYVILFLAGLGLIGTPLRHIDELPYRLSWAFLFLLLAFIWLILSYAVPYIRDRFNRSMVDEPGNTTRSTRPLLDLQEMLRKSAVDADNPLDGEERDRHSAEDA